MNIADVKKLNLVSYLDSLGYKPAKIHGKNYWYRSPFRDENTASFKVNTQLNTWFDFAEGVGGTIIDFGVRLFGCSVSDFLSRISANSMSLQPIERPLSADAEKQKKVEITQVRSLQNLALLQYFKKRRIDEETGRRFCEQVHFRIDDKNYFAIGFKNDLGGYELRNPFMKASSSPKSVRFVDNKSDRLAVFEGAFDFLSFLTVARTIEVPKLNFLILNSTSFFESSLPKMQAHERVHLFLDNDKTGQKFTALAIAKDENKFSDERKLYKGYNDLNDWLQFIGKPTQQHTLRIN